MNNKNYKLPVDIHHMTSVQLADFAYILEGYLKWAGEAEEFDSIAQKLRQKGEKTLAKIFDDIENRFQVVG